MESKRCSILVVADSLAAKRGDGIAWDNRWPQVLGRLLGPDTNILNKSRRAATSKSLLCQDLSGVDLAIIQLGIVDCVPRYFTELENKWISRVPRGLRVKIISYFKSRRSQEQHRAYVSKDEYKRNLENFLDRCKTAVVIKILEPGEKFYEANPGAAISIKEYNCLIDDFREKYGGLKVVGIPVERVDSLTLDDGYHLNEDGHVFLAELIAGELGFDFEKKALVMPEST